MEPPMRLEPADPVAPPSMARSLRGLGPSYWLRAAGIAVGTALLIAMPTRLVPNGLFARMTPTRPQDYAFLAVSSALVGMTLALRSGPGSRGEANVVAGGLGTYLAVGCPICNKLVVALLGASGALSYFAPLQPLLGAGAIALLLVALRRRLGAVATGACEVPVGRLRRSIGDV